MELEMYRRYSQMARGIEKAELVFKNGRVFSSGTGEFIDGNVAVADGIVIGVGTYEGETEIDLEGKVICPGFIDSHLHLESTLCTPSVTASPASIEVILPLNESIAVTIFIVCFLLIFTNFRYLFCVIH